MNEAAAKPSEIFAYPEKPELHVVADCPEILSDRSGVERSKEYGALDLQSESRLVPELEPSEKVPADEPELRKSPFLKLIKVEAAPLDDDKSVDEYLASHYEIILAISHQLFGRLDGAVFSPDDLAQDVCIELVKRFQINGSGVFQPMQIMQIAKYRYTDALRKLNRFSRGDELLARQATAYFEQRLGHREAEIRLREKYPKNPKNDSTSSWRIHSAISSVYKGTTRRRTLSIEVLQGGIESAETFDVAHQNTDTPKPDSEDASLERMRHFITTSLASATWKSKNPKRCIAIAQKRFVDGRSLAEIGEHFELTESRVSQIITRDIIPALQQSVRDQCLGSDDVAELLYSTA